MFNNKWAKSLTQKFNQVQASDITDTELKSKFLKLKAAKQAGFTLLELLVVVSILAAIAGTASIALQDTDARAAAAAHVVMMDELNKGIRTYKILNKSFPEGFDSLAAAPDSTVANPSTTAALLDHTDGILALEDNVAQFVLTADMVTGLADAGIDSLRYIGEEIVPVDGILTDCAAANLQRTIANRGNAMVAGNIFLPQVANGCGFSAPIETGSVVAVWVGGNTRVLGTDVGENGAIVAAGVVTGFAAGDIGAPLFMAVGLGPGGELFNSQNIGSLTTVPLYRHVSATQYNRFTALFTIGEVNAVDVTIMDAATQVNLAAIVDGAGDTKEEELGEWDGTRNTI